MRYLCHLAILVFLLGAGLSLANADSKSSESGEKEAARKKEAVGKKEAAASDEDEGSGAPVILSVDEDIKKEVSIETPDVGVASSEEPESGEKNKTKVAAAEAGSSSSSSSEEEFAEPKAKKDAVSSKPVADNALPDIVDTDGVQEGRAFTWMGTTGTLQNNPYDMTAMYYGTFGQPMPQVPPQSYQYPQGPPPQGLSSQGPSGLPPPLPYRR